MPERGFREGTFFHWTLLYIDTFGKKA